MKKTNLQTPDPVKLRNTQVLCTYDHPYSPPTNYNELFVSAMREIINWHQEKSPFYARLLKNLNFDANKWLGDLDEIPIIPADFFKLHEIKSIPEKDIILHVTSSGTTGQKSQVFFDQWSLGCAQLMVDFIFKDYFWNQASPSNYLLYSYEPQTNLKLGTSYTDHFLTKYSPAKNISYALKSNGQINGKSSHDFDLYGCIQALETFAEEGLPVRIFGFPAFFYFTIQRMIDLGHKPLKLHPESLVFLGGGWKGHAEKEIIKRDFYRLVEAQLGIPDHRLRDGFGSVEHSIPYVECKNHNFHVPIYAKVIIRDLTNLKSLGYGKEGFLHFLSPYITSIPAHSVMMGDLAILQPAKACGCGVNTDWFSILGRAGISKNKSCAIAASELLKGFA